MNLSTNPIQLVLSLLHISPLDAFFMLECICSQHDFQRLLLIRIYQYVCACPCTPLGIHHITHWGVSNSLGPHVQIPELGASRFSQLLIRDAQLKRGSSADHRGLIFLGPLLGSRVFLSWIVSAFSTIHTCISLCILALRLSVMQYSYNIVSHLVIIL